MTRKTFKRIRNANRRELAGFDASAGPKPLYKALGKAFKDAQQRGTILEAQNAGAAASPYNGDEMNAAWKP